MLSSRSSRSENLEGGLLGGRGDHGTQADTESPAMAEVLAEAMAWVEVEATIGRGRSLFLGRVD